MEPNENAPEGGDPGLPMEFDSESMAEAEVSLRLAEHLLARAGKGSSVRVALDGAHVRVGDNEIFPLESLLAELGWRQVRQNGKNRWQGLYGRGDQALEIHCTSGQGDVVCQVGGKTYRAECKKGPLVRKKGSPEYPLLREAIGQLLTVATVGVDDILVVAVPHSEGFAARALEWRSRPLMVRSGIRIALVGRDGRVDGL